MKGIFFLFYFILNFTFNSWLGIEVFIVNIPHPIKDITK
jgi:hypothetical protein